MRMFIVILGGFVVLLMAGCDGHNQYFYPRYWQAKKLAKVLYDKKYDERDLTKRDKEYEQKLGEKYNTLLKYCDMDANNLDWENIGRNMKSYSEKYIMGSGGFGRGGDEVIAHKFICSAVMPNMIKGYINIFFRTATPTNINDIWIIEPKIRWYNDTFRIGYEAGAPVISKPDWDHIDLKHRVLILGGTKELLSKGYRGRGK